MRTIHSIAGNRQRLDGGAMFGNAPRALWEAWATPDDQNRIELASRALLVCEERRNILFDAGIGAFFSPGLKQRYGIEGEENALLANLERVGRSPADIDLVVLSHLHFDHAGGLLTAWHPDRAPELAFPRARFVVHREAWRRATDPHPRDRASFVPHLNRLLERSGRLVLVNGRDPGPLGPGHRFHVSEGHTPGMLLTEIRSEEGPVVFVADLVPGRAWVHVSITMGYDRFPERLIDEKRSLLETLARQHGRVFFTHDPDCALARITRDEKGRFGSTNPKPELQALPLPPHRRPLP